MIELAAATFIGLVLAAIFPWYIALPIAIALPFWIE